MSSRLWDKGQATDDLVLRFTVGEDYLLDQRLIPYDIRASKAHASMLAAQGYLTSQEAQELTQALDEIGQEECQLTLEEEDCHTALESRLIAKTGRTGEKIHLGRSRNDQVLVALRLYMRDVAQAVTEQTREFAQALQSKATDTELPGYTHMQRAMPSTIKDWLLAFAAEATASAETLRAAESLFERNPLGSAAGYGTPGLDLDRDQTTKALGFKEVQSPVTAAQLSRGKAEAALAFSLTLILQDLGRLAADLCLYNTAEFGFVKLPDAFTTGSSIMPQKRNPDVFELVRAHSAQAPADLHAILGVTAKMTSGYHRDLQLIKAPLFRLIDRTQACLEVMTRAIPQIEFNLNNMQNAMSDDLHAAEKAFELVKSQGLTFREAYRRVAIELKR